MKAIVHRSFGGPEVLETTELEDPSPGRGQVRIQVRAAGVNPADWKLVSGVFGSPELPRTPGIEVAGVVDAVGADRDDVAVGDRVFGWAATGGYAELALVDDLAHIPHGMSFETAATLPVAAETSQRVLDDLGVGAGDTLLVHGAAGSVGGIVLQMAVARGADVVGTASEGNHDYLRQLGATPTIYGDGLVERVRALRPDGVDAVLDVAGRGALHASIELRGGTDRIVTIADPAAAEVGVGFSSTSRAPIAALEAAVALHEGPGLVSPIRASLPLDRAADAFRQGQTGHGRGAIVLLP